MSVKHSRAGSRLIHACPCVGRVPKGTLAPRSLQRSPYTCRYIVPPPRDQAWENLSLAIIVYLSSRSDRGRRYVPVSHPVPPVEDCLLCELNEPQAIKIPSVPPLFPGVAFHPSRVAPRNFANGAADADDAGSLCYPVFVPIPSSILNRGSEPIRSWYHITPASINGIKNGFYRENLYKIYATLYNIFDILSSKICL